MYLDSPAANPVRAQAEYDLQNQLSGPRVKTHQTLKAVEIHVSLPSFLVKGYCEHPTTSHHRDCRRPTVKQYESLWRPRHERGMKPLHLIGETF
jgi:hypothetical protein